PCRRTLEFARYDQLAGHSHQLTRIVTNSQRCNPEINRGGWRATAKANHLINLQRIGVARLYNFASSANHVADMDRYGELCLVAHREQDAAGPILERPENRGLLRFFPESGTYEDPYRSDLPRQCDGLVEMVEFAVVIVVSDGVADRQGVAQLRRGPKCWS